MERSADKIEIFCFRVRDVNPRALKNRFAIPKNKYDFLFYYKDFLFPIEAKSTSAKSISFSESIIKANQIKSLTEDSKFEGVIPGFIFNFRSVNETYFVYIHDFNKYKHIAENQLPNSYKAKVNRASIPVAICREIGYRIPAKLLRTRYRYDLDSLFNELIEHYSYEVTNIERQK